MNFGRLALTLGPARSASSDPLSAIFAVPGTRGGVLSFDYTRNRMWTTSDRTTLVTAETDPIGYVAPLYGTGLYVQQTNAAARPVAGDARATLSGSQYLPMPTPGFSLRKLFLCFVAEETTDAEGGGVVTAAPASGNDYDQLGAFAVETEGASTPGQLTFVANVNVGIGRLLATISGAGLTAKAVYSIVLDDGSVSVRRNGVVEASDTGDQLSATHGGDLLLGARYVSGALVNYVGHYHGLFTVLSDRIPTSDEIDLIEAATAAEAGL